jgi:hypothetical protein
LPASLAVACAHVIEKPKGARAPQGWKRVMTQRWGLIGASTIAREWVIGAIREAGG